MAKRVLTDAQIFHDEHDFTSLVTTVDTPITEEELDSTTFGSGGNRTRTAGLRSAGLSLSGYWDSTIIDVPADADLGSATPIVSVCDHNTVGTGAVLFQAKEFTYGRNAQIGQIVPFNLEYMSTGPVPIKNARLLFPKTQISADTDGTAVQLGALAAGETLYAALHIFEVTTGTLTVTIESDDNSGMTTPTTRDTATAATVPGVQWLTVAGPVTDDWWRFEATLTAGTATPALTAGIQ